MTDIAPHTGDWFATEFDGPPAVLDVPGAVRNGQDPTLRLVDQFVRGRKIVGRSAAAHCMVGLKARGVGRPIRVTVEMRLDAASDEWWLERATSERADKAQVEAAGVGNQPRLMLLRAQGQLRQALLLSKVWRGGRPMDARAIVPLDMAPDEIPDDGLLVVELCDATPYLPDWAAQASIAESSIGVRIDAITVDAIENLDRPSDPLDAWTAQREGLVSAGGFVGEPGRRDCGPARTPFIIINPIAFSGRSEPAAARCRIRLLERPVHAGHPHRPVTRSRSLATRAAGRATRLFNRWVAGSPASAPIPSDQVEIRAVGLADGSSVPVSVVEAANGLDLSIPATASGPVLVKVAATRGVRPGRRLACEIVTVKG